MADTASLVLYGMALVTVAAGSINDFTYRRLPNLLTITSALIGLILQGWLFGGAGLLDGLAGGAAALALFFPFFIVSWMGAGDVKLLIAVGVYLGWPLGLLADALTLGIGAGAAFGILAWQGGLGRYLRRYASMVKCLLSTGQFAYVPPAPEETASARFPYAFAIALGTFGAILSATELPALIKAVLT